MNTNERNYPERTVAVLNNGDTAIVVDDHCYAIRNWSGEAWEWSSHVFGEALAALKILPDNPDEAESVPFVWPANVLADRPAALHAAGPESEANGVERRVRHHG